MLKIELKAGRKRKLVTSPSSQLLNDEKGLEDVLAPKKSLVIPAEPRSRIETGSGPQNQGKGYTSPNKIFLGVILS